MRPRHAFMLLLLVGSCAFAQEALSRIQTLRGFDLRLLDKRVPLVITVDGHTEQHEISIWVHMPKKGEAAENVEVLAEPADLAGGTSVLPAPPTGFALRALRSAYRETLTLKNGQLAIIETPVFIYYPRILPMATLAPEVPAAPKAHQQAKLQQQPNDLTIPRHYGEMFKELRSLNAQLTDVLSLLPDGTAKERIRQLGQHYAAVTGRNDTSFAYNPDGTVDRDVR